MEKENSIGVADVFVDDHGVGLISSVGVLPSYRKKGVGSALMNKAIQLIFAEKS
ncbi:MAG: GNAT family N-acetyltransferase [Holosporaceae bacterium]|nr:MAG: GNAT family N-acetyltransferase [Holosporaceae bacterium]